MFSKFASAAILFTSFASASMKPGKCPDRPQNKPLESFNPYSMAGLWYEYVWDQGFSQGYGYECSTWIVLNNEEEAGPGNYVTYNNMLFPLQEGDDISKNDFVKFTMMWDEPTEAGQKARASYRRQDDELEEGQQRS